jgi:hypothetical protein
MQWPRDWSVMPNPMIHEVVLEGSSNFENPVVGGDLLIDYWLQIRYLQAHTLFQHVKVHNTCYCNLSEKKGPNNIAPL